MASAAVYIGIARAGLNRPLVLIHCLLAAGPHPVAWLSFVLPAMIAYCQFCSHELRYLTKNLMMKSKIRNLVLLAGLLFLVAGLQAQIYAGRTHTFDTDTLTNAETVTLPFPKNVNTMDVYDYLYQIKAENLSGTTAANVIVQESLFDSGNFWVPVDTVAVSGSSDLFVTGTVQGVRQRLVIVGSGTQSTQLQVIGRIRKQ